MNNSSQRFQLYQMLFLAVLLCVNRQVTAETPITLPVILSFTQKIEFPTQNTDTKIHLDSNAVQSRAQFENKTGFSTFSPDLYTWNLALKPGYGLQILGGSIGTAGLPSRVKNLITPLVTPVFRPVTPERNWILSPGTTRSTESCAIESQQDEWRLVLFSNPTSFPDENTWICNEFSQPFVLPYNTSINLSLFSGFRHFLKKKETSWFITPLQKSYGTTLFPAAELIIGNANFTFSTTAVGNIPQLKKNAGAIRTDGAITLGWITLAGAFFQSSRGFTEFDGAVPQTRERQLVAPSLAIPIPYTRRTIFRLRFLYAQDFVSPQKLNDPYEEKKWYGSRISLENTYLFAQGTGIYKNEQYTMSGRISAYRFFLPWLRIFFTGKASLPDNNLSRYAWLNQKYRIQVSGNGTVKNKKGRISLSGTMTQKDRFSKIEYRISATLAGTIITKHSTQKLSAECSFSTEKPVYTAKFYFSTFLH